MFSSPPLPNQATLTKDQLSNCSSANKVSLLGTNNKTLTLINLTNYLKISLLGYSNAFPKMLTQKKHCVNKDFDNMCIVRLAVLIFMALMMSI